MGITKHDGIQLFWERTGVPDSSSSHPQASWSFSGYCVSSVRTNHPDPTKVQQTVVLIYVMTGNLAFLKGLMSTEAGLVNKPPATTVSVAQFNS